MTRYCRGILFLMLTLIMAFSTAGCGNTPAAEIEEPEETANNDTVLVAESSGEVEESVSEENDPVFVDFDPNNFSNPTDISNQWLPMKAGTQWVFEGITIEGDEEIPHRIEFTVTDLTKEIEGVNTVVAWIVDITEDEVVEKEIAFYAQDDDGNVWYFGEHPEEYEEGEFVDAPTWIAGKEEARAGVKMWANPQLDSGSYYQGWAPSVEWSDYGQVDEMGMENCVALGCYEDVLVIAESSLDEEGIFQLKFYAPDIGNIRVGWRGEVESQEDLELIELNQLDADALLEIRGEALALEEHAYEVSSDVYGETAPAIVK